MDDRSLTGRVRRALRPRTRVRALLSRAEPALKGSTPGGGTGGGPGSHGLDDKQLLDRSGLFDLDWYNRCTGSSFGRLEAIEHYLGKGRALGFSPHPLFDPAYFTAARPHEVGESDPLVVYLRGRRFRAPTHPLFAVRRYVKDHPEAVKHPMGPIGHYVEVGAPAGARPNDWYVPAPETDPRGLVGWIDDRADDWRRRRADARDVWVRQPPRAGRQAGVPAAEGRESRPAENPARGTPWITVLLPVDADRDGEWAAAARSVRSLQQQTWQDWELLVLHDGGSPTVEDELLDLAGDPRVRVVVQPIPGLSPAWNFGLSIARGDRIGWMAGGDEWDPDRLSRLATAPEAGTAPWLCDVLEERSAERPTRYSGRRPTLGRIRAGAQVELGAVVVRRDVAVRLDGFDERVPAAADRDFVLKLAAVGEPAFVRQVGVRRDVDALRARRAVPARERPWVDHAEVATWRDVALNRNLVDWTALRDRRQVQDLTSVVMATYNDWRMTEASVRSVLRAARQDRTRVQVVVVDNGCHLAEAVALQSLPARYPSVRVVTSPVNHGFALGNNLALPHVRGDVVVFLNNDTEVMPGWLAPLRESLDDPEVLGVQSLLVYPDGTVQSAGVAFPEGGGIPHAFLQGFPIEDAGHVAGLRFNAVTAAALAMRYEDFVRLDGFDPLYRNGMEDVDLGLRMAAARPGYFAVRSDSVVVHHESQTPGRFTSLKPNRRLYVDRWADKAPEDDAALWRACGYEVEGHELTDRVSNDRRLWLRSPVLRRAAATSVVEAPPRLRWAIKNPAPAGPQSETWGDTHFARRLAVALRELGQEVVVDHRPAFDRPSGRFDDVVLAVRGLAPYRPAFGQVNLAWLISHPEMFARWEPGAYDRVFAASVTWAEETSRRWGTSIEPLLQATDPQLFHPDLAKPDTGHPVLFVGSSRKQQRPLVRAAVDAGLPLSVYGRDWKGFIPDRYVKATYFPNGELGSAYRAAGVVLNDHWEDMRTQGFVSNRLFDAVAAGARVITDDVSGLEGLFGRSVQVAHSEEDLARLANAPDLDAVFGTDEERREAAARVHRDHSFLARARTLLDAALQVRRDNRDRHSA